eukprot:Selendium_serpulae@DN2498_c0_g1_i1.p2
MLPIHRDYHCEIRNATTEFFTANGLETIRMELPLREESTRHKILEKILRNRSHLWYLNHPQHRAREDGGLSGLDGHIFDAALNPAVILSQISAFVASLAQDVAGFVMILGRREADDARNNSGRMVREIDTSSRASLSGAGCFLFEK